MNKPGDRPPRSGADFGVDRGRIRGVDRGRIWVPIGGESGVSIGDGFEVPIGTSHSADHRVKTDSRNAIWEPTQ